MSEPPPLEEPIPGRTGVGSKGELHLPESVRRNWGLTPGAEFRVEETDDGLLLRPADPPLRKVYVEPTTSCNVDCPICMRHSWVEPGGTMAMSTYRRLLEGLREVPSLQSVAFWGQGEPLLHPDIVDMVRLAGELGASTQLITNGLLLDPTIAEGLVLAGLSSLVLSVEGFAPASHDQVRAGSNLAELEERVRALRAVRRAHRRRNPEIGLAFVVTRRNASELAELRRLAYTLAASFVVVSNVLPYTKELSGDLLYQLSISEGWPQGRSRWQPEIRLPRLDTRHECAEPLLALLQHGGTTDPLLERAELEYGYCRFVRQGSVAVAWDGGVSPCIPLMHSYTCYVLDREKAIRRCAVGNVNDEPVARIYAREEYRQFRSRVVQFDFAPCANCGGCQFSETNEEDCYGNQFPVCGDCLWARGIIQCP